MNAPYIAAALMLALAALMFGLWIGERGRRMAAERTLTFGTPESLPKSQPRSYAPAAEAETRFMETAAAASKEAVRRLTDDLEKAAVAQGYVLPHADAERQARAMLAGIDQDVALEPPS